MSRVWYDVSLIGGREFQEYYTESDIIIAHQSSNNECIRLTFYIKWARNTFGRLSILPSKYQNRTWPTQPESRINGSLHVALHPKLPGLLAVPLPVSLAVFTRQPHVVTSTPGHGERAGGSSTAGWRQRSSRGARADSEHAESRPRDNLTRSRDRVPAPGQPHTQPWQTRGSVCVFPSRMGVKWNGACGDSGQGHGRTFSHGSCFIQKVDRLMRMDVSVRRYFLIAVVHMGNLHVAFCYKSGVLRNLSSK